MDYGLYGYDDVRYVQRQSTMVAKRQGPVAVTSSTRENLRDTLTYINMLSLCMVQYGTRVLVLGIWYFIYLVIFKLVVSSQ